MPGFEKTTIGNYRIERYLARGGMSEIYLAQDIRSDQTVAIKLVHSSKSHKCERFRREIKVTSLLTHDHILPILDQGEYDSWCYMVTPYFKNGSLSDRLAAGPLSFTEAGTILRQLASVLQVVHEHGMVHCDIKPANILVGTEGHIYLADFGLVRDMHEKCDQDSTCPLIGTAEYMAPELAEAQASPQSDIYALGILLYQMLTGRVPFSGSTPIGSYLKHIWEQPTPPSQLNPTIPLSLEQVILRALEKDPQCRFQTTGEFAQAYDEACMVASTMPHLRPGKFASSAELPALPHLHTHVMKQRGLGDFLKASVVAVAASFMLVILPLMLGYSLAPRQEILAVTQENMPVETHVDIPISAVSIIPAIISPPGAVEEREGEIISIPVAAKIITGETDNKCFIKYKKHKKQICNDETTSQEGNQGYTESEDYDSEQSFYKQYLALLASEKNTSSVDDYSQFNYKDDQKQESTGKQKKGKKAN